MKFLIIFITLIIVFLVNAQNKNKSIDKDNNDTNKNNKFSELANILKQIKEKTKEVTMKGSTDLKSIADAAATIDFSKIKDLKSLKKLFGENTSNPTDFLSKLKNLDTNDDSNPISKVLKIIETIDNFGQNKINNLIEQEKTFLNQIEMSGNFDKLELTELKEKLTEIESQFSFDKFIEYVNLTTKFIEKNKDKFNSEIINNFENMKNLVASFKNLKDANFIDFNNLPKASDLSNIDGLMEFDFSKIDSLNNIDSLKPTEENKEQILNAINKLFDLNEIENKLSKLQVNQNGEIENLGNINPNEFTKNLKKLSNDFLNTNSIKSLNNVDIFNSIDVKGLLKDLENLNKDDENVRKPINTENEINTKDGKKIRLLVVILISLIVILISFIACIFYLKKRQFRSEEIDYSNTNNKKFDYEIASQSSTIKI